jgi:hypothetical protein
MKKVPQRRSGLCPSENPALFVTKILLVLMKNLSSMMRKCWLVGWLVGDYFLLRGFGLYIVYLYIG